LIDGRGTMERQTITGPDRDLLDRIRTAVREVEPGARVILYGSRARGDAEAESDWDLLVLLDGPVDHARARAVHRRLLDLPLGQEDCPALSAIMREKAEWDSSLFRAMPFRANVEREGVELGAVRQVSSSATG
jgi:predicted nucleotidyltransferase